MAAPSLLTQQIQGRVLPRRQDVFGDRQRDVARAGALGHEDQVVNASALPDLAGARQLHEAKLGVGATAGGESREFLRHLGATEAERGTLAPDPVRVIGEVVGRAGRDDLAASGAALGAEVDDVVRRLDDEASMMAACRRALSDGTLRRCYLHAEIAAWIRGAGGRG